MSKSKKLKHVELIDNNDISFHHPELKSKISDSQNKSILKFAETCNGYVFVLSDGKEHVGGRKISRLVAESVITFFTKQYHKDPLPALKTAMNYANRQIFFKSNHNDLINGISTNCVIILIRDDLVYYSYVGKNNFYIKFQNKIERISEDFSTVESDEIDQDQETDTVKTMELSSTELVDTQDGIIVCDSPFTPSNDNIIFLFSNDLKKSLTQDNIQEILNKEDRLFIQGKDIMQHIKENDPDANIAFQLIKFNDVRFVDNAYKDYYNFFTFIINRIIAGITSKAVLVLLFITIIVLSFLHIKYNTPAEAKIIEKEIHQDIKAVEKEVEKFIEEPIYENLDTVLAYIVKPQEVLYDIAIRFNLDENEIAKTNKIGESGVKEGDTIQIKLRAIHYVEPDETLNTISRLYDTPINIIKTANKIPTEADVILSDFLYIPYNNILYQKDAKKEVVKETPQEDNYAKEISDTYVISGYVRDSKNIGIKGITITFGNGIKSTITSGSGHFAREVPSHWSGQATPVLDGYTFIPSKKSINNIQSKKSLSFSGFYTKN